MTKGSILIVDDEPIVREAIRDWMVDAGYSVATASTGEEAIEIVNRQDFGVVVLDVRLPGKTGIRVLQEIKQLKPQIKAIVITAYASPELRAEALGMGAVQYLSKPIAPDQLEKHIQSVLAE